MLGALLDLFLDCLPKGLWDPEGKEYTALYLHFDHFHENQLMTDDPEAKDSGEQCFLVVPEAEDLDEIPLQEAVSLLGLAAKVVV